MPLVPTYIHPRFDGTQTRLGPLKLGATYLVNSLVWIAGCFAIAANEVPLPSCYCQAESKLGLKQKIKKACKSAPA